MREIFMDAAEVAKALGVSRSYAYKAIRQWNEELKEKGYFTKAGSVPRAYFQEKCYGLTTK